MVWMKPPEAAKHAGIAYCRILRWMKEGLPYSEDGPRTRYIDTEDLDVFIEGRKKKVEKKVVTEDEERKQKHDSFFSKLRGGS